MLRHTIIFLSDITSFKKDNEFNKKNYRPVSILPSFNNVFEKILVNQFEDFYENILSDHISAYRKNYSCETSLLKLTEDWRQSLDNKEIVAVISLDLSNIKHSTAYLTICSWQSLRHMVLVNIL